MKTKLKYYYNMPYRSRSRFLDYQYRRMDDIIKCRRYHLDMTIRYNHDMLLGVCFFYNIDASRIIKFYKDNNILPEVWEILKEKYIQHFN